MHKVILLAGISGAGKSTYAGKLFEHHRLTHSVHTALSADDFPGLYFDGELVFDFLPKAHSWCVRSYINTLADAERGHDSHLIVVHNTNTTVSELAPYVAIARAFGVEPDCRVLRIDAYTAIERNIHNVPRSTVFQQSQRLADMMENWPSFFPPLTCVKVEPNFVFSKYASLA